MTDNNETLFNESNDEEQAAFQGDNLDNADEVTLLKSQGKFVNEEGEIDLSALAKGKVESDRFINQLQNELKGLREELNTRLSLKEFLDKMEQKTGTSNEQTASNQERVQGSMSDKENTALTPEEIQKIINKSLSEYQQQTQTSKNISLVSEKLKEAWGPGFKNKLREKASDLGVDTDYLDNMAKTQPNLFLKIVGVDPSSTPQKPPSSRSEVPRSSQFVSPPIGESGKRNFAYYQKIRKENPSAYWSPKLQTEMHRQASELGEDFYK